MTKFYVDIEDGLGQTLKNKVEPQDIVEVLRELAENETFSDELAAYDSVPEIMADSELTEAQRTRLKLKAERRNDISNR